MKRSGTADLPLHGGRVPSWLADRMTRLGTAITEAVDGHPFPVPLTTYDETIGVLRASLDRARVGDTDKLDGMTRLDRFVRAVETRRAPAADFDAALAHARAMSPALGGRTVFDRRARPRPRQLDLF
jgi:hypothetical protein